MIFLPDAIIRYISTYLSVMETLNFEVGFNRFNVNKREDLLLLYHREPKTKSITVQKKDREITYKLHSYFDDNRLYTKVISWYGSHKIISVVTHKMCQSTVEANLWTMNVFTLKSPSFYDLRKMRNRIPLLLQLHFQ